MGEELRGNVEKSKVSGHPAVIATQQMGKGTDEGAEMDLLRLALKRSHIENEIEGARNALRREADEAIAERAADWDETTIELQYGQTRITLGVMVVSIIVGIVFIACGQFFVRELHSAKPPYDIKYDRNVERFAETAPFVLIVLFIVLASTTKMLLETKLFAMHFEESKKRRKASVAHESK